jgi:N-acetylglutamate synthase-like GNAT family acetyltransferase
MDFDVTDFDIIELADAPELLDTCASWSFGLWGCQSGGSLAATQADFVSATRHARDAFTFVARRSARTAGMASLRASDFKGRPDLTPWLAGVYVHPEHRRAGLAHALVQRVEAQARQQGHLRLYLITEQAETLYAELGWATFDQVVSSHGPAALMTRKLE